MKHILLIMALMWGVSAQAKTLLGQNDVFSLGMGSNTEQLAVNGDCNEIDSSIQVLVEPDPNNPNGRARVKGAFFFQCPAWTYERTDTGEVLTNPACFTPGCTNCTDPAPPPTPDDGIWDVSVVVNNCLIHSDCRLRDALTVKGSGNQTLTTTDLLCRSDPLGIDVIQPGVSEN